MHCSTPSPFMRCMVRMRRGTHTIVAKELIADHGVFTIMKPIKFKPEGATRFSLENARMIAVAGYRYKSGIFQFHPQHGGYETSVIFERGGETASHTFKGFSFGYGGEGPSGLVEFGEMFYIGFDKEKIYGRKIIDGLPNEGMVTFDLNDFR
jgi:hypothetical protein